MYKLFTLIFEKIYKTLIILKKSSLTSRRTVKAHRKISTPLEWSTTLFVEPDTSVNSRYLLSTLVAHLRVLSLSTLSRLPNRSHHPAGDIRDSRYLLCRSCTHVCVFFAFPLSFYLSLVKS